MALILLLLAPILLLMTTVTSDETIPSMSHIISTVVKFVTGYFLLVSDWIIDHFPEVQGWVISQPLYAAAAIVGVAILVFVLVPWLGRVFVRCLGFGTKGVTRGSTAARYQSWRLGGSVPAGSMFSSFQSMGATQR
ncbi:hypothetical protein PISMIDRAFT_291286 [Pisolithus microcarpus 441]|uniref:Uncharacterized protein n=1 Tax=Pisolithus microcarpus 441 TaxID=765257 RepID=A0A0C9YGB1_9AGAM|nr:hypothetical protein BKA83DRAFT_291286 [Pisolithus microcarpus]KIK15681.1 hypothetical protein PISMIDRAFT_291286 [Pisolithus microcarpus 441]